MRVGVIGVDMRNYAYHRKLPKTFGGVDDGYNGAKALGLLNGERDAQIHKIIFHCVVSRVMIRQKTIERNRQAE